MLINFQYEVQKLIFRFKKSSIKYVVLEIKAVFSA